MIHHLLEKDPETREALCSVCGPVGITRSGKGWVCSEKAKASSREWRRQNPERVNRNSKSRHTLLSQDHETMKGVCPVDGVVTIVPWGRGYGCSVRAKERGWVRGQAAPQGYCKDCQAADGVLVWLSTGKDCPRCAETDLNMEFAKMAADKRLLKARASESWMELGVRLVGMPDPYKMPDVESAVPGWKTLGSTR